jgi:hypothetical protein
LDFPCNLHGQGKGHGRVADYEPKAYQYVIAEAVDRFDNYLHPF